MRRIALLLLVSGCNQLLDLDAASEQSSATADRDGDGVADSRDNCLDIPNPDQLDRDHDRIGDVCDGCPDHLPTADRDSDGIDDACDACSVGPNVDDDGDGIFDACDICPATATDDDTDEDFDLIGDACDAPGTLFDDRLAFVDFSAIDQAWPGASDWTEGADNSSITPAGSALASITLTSSDVTPFSVSAMFDLVNDGEVGIDFGAGITCTIQCAGDTCQLSAVNGNDARLVTHSRFSRVTIHAAAIIPGFNPLGRIICEAFVADQRIDFSLESETSHYIVSATLFASPGERILGADIVE